MGAGQALKRIPRIKFPQRHPKPSGSAPEIQASSSTTDASLAFFKSSNASSSVGGKASLQPKRTPVSKEEIEAILGEIRLRNQQLPSFLPSLFLLPYHGSESLEDGTPSITKPGTAKFFEGGIASWWKRGKKPMIRKSLVSMFKLFTLRGLPWSLRSGGQEKVELTVVEVESLRSELADIEEREAQLKAQLENIDEILRSARLSGYLYIRKRWAALPGEPPPIDDTEVDDWLPRFVVLQGACLFLYLLCTDLSPHDSTLLSDIVEVDKLPSFKREEDDETRYAFYILTRHGLRYECSSSSQIQVDSWLSALHSDCKLETDTSTPNGSIEL
ncbi:hypothetical protein HKD37_11G030252 [Glycine soja]